VVDGVQQDLSESISADASLRFITRRDPEALDIIRHDAAHVLAEAVQELFPGTQVTIGPAIENGFYYDFARNEPFTPEDFPAIEAKMREIIARNAAFEREVWPREQAIAFSDGYVTNGLCLLVAKDSAIQSAADLKPGVHKVAVKLATTGHQWARAEMPGLQLVTLDNAANCAMEVVQGKVDAFIYDQISIYQFWKKFENETRPILHPVREETWAIGLRKGEDDLRDAVNAFLADYRAKGKFDELAQRYMAEPKATFEKMGVPFIFH
jgi:hypothetical protein